MSTARVLGVVGWSGSGKTYLLTRLLPLLVGRGVKVATVKHAHHSFDVDQEGKDSYEHRRAGAREVIVSSARRWAQMHDLNGEPEATLAQLLAKVSPCDLVLVEGFKRQRHPKLEVFRQVIGLSPLHPHDARIIGVASDRAFPDARVPVVSLEDLEAIANLVLTRAEPLPDVIAALESAPH